MMKFDRWNVVAIVFLSAATLALPACINTVCERDEDCGGGQICNEITGQCMRPECTSLDDCDAGQVCDDYVCVAGCTSEADCGDGEICLNNRCVQVSPCDCPLAPAFCQEDINPGSPTTGEQVCMTESFDKGVLLFFGSVRCSICKASFGALLDLQSTLEADGADLTLMFVQLKDVQVTSEEVETNLGTVDAHVVQDTEALGIWETYNADWYDVIVVDAVGCYYERFDHVYSSQIEGALGEQIGEVWTASTAVECTE